MLIENARIECPAKPITHAFIHFKNDDERNKYSRPANMLKKELRERKLKITRSMDAEERFHQKRMVYVKYCIHVKHTIPLDLVPMNWTLKHVSVKGQIVAKTCQSGRLKYIKSTTNVSSREMGQKRRDEGKSTSSPIHTATQENQRSDRSTSEGGRRDKLKKVDGLSNMHETLTRQQ